jgi:predicted ATPase
VGGFIYLELKNGSGMVYDRGAEGDTSVKPKAGLKKASAQKNNPEATTGDDYEKLDPRELWLGQVNNTKRFPGATALSKALHSVEVYTEFDTSEESKMRGTMTPTGYDKLLSNGSNLFQVLNTINLNSTEAFDAIEYALQEVNPHFRRLRPVVYGNGAFEMQIQEEQLRTPTSAAHLSDGTLRYLCLLAIALNPLPSGLIALDEPERGLHPDMILQIYQHLEKKSEQGQIILTTHLPELLNLFPLYAVRVFEKDAFNQTQVLQFTEEQFAGWYDEFVPGQMWRNGTLGGNRY